MKTDMLNAFNSYFQKLELLYKNTFDSMPTVSYTTEINKELLVGKPDKNYEIQWLPKVQKTTINWSFVENRIGFEICPILKEYYSSYYFLSLSGIYKNTKLDFYYIDGITPIEQIVIRNYEDAQYVFPQLEVFLIGNACVDGDDGFFIYFDNSSEELFCFEYETKKKMILSDSIFEVIEKMEACI